MSSIVPRILEMISVGACLQIFGDPDPRPLGGVVDESQPDGSTRLRFSPPFPESQHDLSEVVFDEFQDNGRSVLFLRKNQAVCGIGPYADWPGVDFNAFLPVLEEWNAYLQIPEYRAEFADFLKLA